MAGHNKWTQIKRQKAVSDSKKSKVFSKYSKIITLAAKNGDNPAMNPELRNAIEKAKKENMPNENIERAITKGSGAGGINLENARYEAYGPGGSAIIIDVITDNKNRAVAEVKKVLAEHDAKLAEQGSVLWAFDISPQKVSPKIILDVSESDKESNMALIEDLNNLDDTQEIYTNIK